MADDTNTYRTKNTTKYAYIIKIKVEVDQIPIILSCQTLCNNNNNECSVRRQIHDLKAPGDL